LTQFGLVGKEDRSDSTWPIAVQISRQRIEKLSGEVVDSNPYSRLMALQRMGIVKDYESIRSKTVRCWLLGYLGDAGSTPALLVLVG
jgi:hypothetical protein